MKSYLPLTLIFLFLISCKKDPIPDPPVCFPLTASPYKIAEEKYYHGVDSTLMNILQYEYDSLGRIHRTLIYTLDTLSGTVVYEYFNDRVEVNGFPYNLNEQGLVSSIAQFVKYWYDEDGYMVKHFQTGGGYAYYDSVIYQCHNPVLVCRSYTNRGEYNDTTYQTFYTNQINTIGNENRGIYFFGKQSNTLIQSERTRNQTTMAYTYIFDDQQRVLWQIINAGTSSVQYRKFRYL